MFTVETDLSVPTFAQYFQNKKLGNLYFPHGKAFAPPVIRPVFAPGIVSESPFYIGLSDSLQVSGGMGSGPAESFGE